MRQPSGLNYGAQARIFKLTHYPPICSLAANRYTVGTLRMERTPTPDKQPPRIDPDKLDLSDRLPDEPATVEDLETLRNEINYKLALLLHL
jgi:hypothetical protein